MRDQTIGRGTHISSGTERRPVLSLLSRHVVSPALLINKSVDVGGKSSHPPILTQANSQALLLGYAGHGTSSESPPSSGKPEIEL